jgi:HTH-type transcriptional regulator / antitoxin HigA
MTAAVNTLTPIRSEDDYRAALKQAEAFFDANDEPSPDSAEGAYFEALITLIEAYERKHHPIESPDPVDALKFRMDQMGLTPADLVPYIGARHRVYEVLNRKRPLTMAMIRRLMSLGIPASSLVGVPIAVAA